MKKDKIIPAILLVISLFLGYWYFFTDAKYTRDSFLTNAIMSEKRIENPDSLKFENVKVSNPTENRKEVTGLVIERDIFGHTNSSEFTIVLMYDENEKKFKVSSVSVH